jgi:DNA-binding transcriptional ArsR family regulator
MDSQALADRPRRAPASSASTSVDKAFDVCEALSLEPGGMSLSDLSRALKQPRPSVHRLLTVLKRRGYVRQDEETQRYSLGVKTLDLSFRMLGRSELRMHAYPVLKDYAAYSGCTSFLAVPASGEVTLVQRSTTSGVSLSTVYGREMPAHCAQYFGVDGHPASARLSPPVHTGGNVCEPSELGAERAKEAASTESRFRSQVRVEALTCLRLADARDVARGSEVVRHLGFGAAQEHPAGAEGQRLCCTCAPVFDYSGREAARIGVCAHGPDDRAIAGVHNRGAWELARHVSMRLGYLSAVAMGVT